MSNVRCTVDGNDGKRYVDRWSENVSWWISEFKVVSTSDPTRSSQKIRT